MNDESTANTDLDPSAGALPRGTWWERRGDLAVTLVLTVATLLTAWAGFQSAKWSGVQTINFSEAGRARADSNAAANAGFSNVTVDAAVFVAWLEAAQPQLDDGAGIEEVTEGDGLASYLYQRFSGDTLRPAADDWIAQGLFTGTTLPFSLDSYTVDQLALSERLRDDAEAFSSTARDNNQQSDHYVLLTVLFASTLFLAGLCQKLAMPSAQITLFGVSFVILIIGAVALLGQPIEFSAADLPW